MKKRRGHRGERRFFAAAAAALLALLPPLGAGAFPAPATVPLYGELREQLRSWDMPAARRALEALPEGDDAERLWISATVDFYSGDYETAAAGYRRLAGRVPADARVERRARLAEDTAAMAGRLTEYESAHFVLSLDAEKDWVLAEGALETLEQAYERHGRWLGKRPSVKVRVEIVPRLEDFEKVSGLSKSQIETAGAVGTCVFNKIMLLSPRLLLRGYRWRDSLAHEYLHYLMMRLSAGRAPIWLQEGAARYGESFWRSEESLHLDRRAESLLAGAQADGELLPFAAMGTSFVDLPSMKQVSLAFAQSAHAVGYLTETWGDEGLRKLLAAFAAQEGESADGALVEALGIGLKEFEERWRSALGGSGLRSVPGLVIPELKVGEAGEEEDDWDLRRWQPVEAARHVRLGDMLRARGREKPAFLEYRRGLAKAPASPLVMNRAGEALHALSRFDEAAGQFREAIDLHPDYGPSYLNLARALRALGDGDGEERALEGALEINPFNPAVWMERGSLLMERGKSEEARASLETAIRLRPGDPALERLMEEHGRKRGR